MGDFDSLPTLNIPRERIPEGCEVRQRASEPSAERDDMDAKVEAAKGTWQKIELPPNEQLAAGRMMPRARAPLWAYIIPSDAFDKAR